MDYRTPAEVETELWEHHPGQEIMEIKAQAEEQNPGHFTPPLIPAHTATTSHPDINEETTNLITTILED